MNASTHTSNDLSQINTIHSFHPSSLRLTPRGRHATMAMIELARHSGPSPLPLTIIANIGNISLSYLEQLFSGLRRNGLVQSTRGPGGGYRLAREAASIHIVDILIAAEDSVPARRLRGSEAERTNPEAEALWNHVGEILFERLSKVTLQDALNNKGF